LAGTDGEFAVEPICNETGLVFIRDVDINEVSREKVTGKGHFHAKHPA